MKGIDMNNNEIAHTINSQLNLCGLQVRWSWGIHALRSLPAMEGFCGGLQAKVKGRKFSGHIRIWLTGMDDYTIQLGSLRKGIFKVTKSVDGIYCDTLADTVDDLIETD
jgi:hypothetical protein